jgi:hypothetical protein
MLSSQASGLYKDLRSYETISILNATSDDIVLIDDSLGGGIMFDEKPPLSDQVEINYLGSEVRYEADQARLTCCTQLTQGELALARGNSISISCAGKEIGIRDEIIQMETMLSSQDSKEYLICLGKEGNVYKIEGETGVLKALH